MKKKKILIIILTILISVTLCFLGFLVIKNLKKPTNNPKEEIFKVSPQEFNHCKNEKDERCKYVGNTLRYISTDKSYPLLNNAIEETNSIVEEKFIETIHSNLDAQECDAVRDIYNYRKIYMMAEFLYETKDLVGIAYEFTGIDICTNEKTTSYNSYIYDTKKNRMLSNDEIFDLYSLKNEDVLKAITKNINKWNKTDSTNYTINDIDNNYKLYLSKEGNLEVFYTIKNNLKSYNTTVFVQ